MKQVVYKLAKSILRRQGYKIALIKSDNGTTELDGDMEWIKYVDVVGYLFKKEPLKRDKIDATEQKRSNSLDIIEGC
jgi:hypothetical protein